MSPLDENTADFPAEKLKSENWRRWCENAGWCTRFCRLCGLPMDAAEGKHPDDRCPICAALETTLAQRPYWRTLTSNHRPRDFSKIGLE